MHIRVKRKDVVLFLYVDPSETVRDVKNKVEALLGQVQAYTTQHLQVLLQLIAPYKFKETVLRISSIWCSL